MLLLYLHYNYHHSYDYHYHFPYHIIKINITTCGISELWVVLEVGQERHTAQPPGGRTVITGKFN